MNADPCPFEQDFMPTFDDWDSLDDSFWDSFDAQRHEKMMGNHRKPANFRRRQHA